MRASEDHVQVSSVAVSIVGIDHRERGEYLARRGFAWIDAFYRQRSRFGQQVVNRAHVDALHADFFRREGMAEDRAVRRQQIDLRSRIDNHCAAGQFGQRRTIDLAADDQRFCIDDVHRQRGIQSLTQLFVVHTYAVAVDQVERRAEQKDNCQHCGRQLVMEAFHAHFSRSSKARIL